VRWSRSGVAGVAVAASLGAAALAPAHDVADSGAPPGSGDPLPAGNVARVAPSWLVSEADYDHWFRAAAAQAGGTPKEGTKAYTKLRKQTMRFLISAAWLQLEAPEHGVEVTKSQITKELKRQKRRAFDSEAEYQAFLKRTKRTEKNLRLQIKLTLLTRGVQKHAVAGAKTSAERKAALKRFVDAFQRKWLARTACATGYKTSQCSTEVRAG
jgi:hypothetical protein